MIRYVALGAVFAIVLGVMFGLMSKVHPLPAAPFLATRQTVPSITPPQSDLRAAAHYFSTLHPPPAPPKPPPPPPKPIPPDIATLFRRDVGAILDGSRVVVSSMDNGRRVSRILKPGDFYADGWQLASLTNRSAILRNGREERLVNFFGPSPIPAAPPVVVGKKGH